MLIGIQFVQGQVPIYWQPQWLSSATTLDSFDSQRYHSQHLAEPLATIESALRISVSENSQPVFYSSQLNSSLPLSSAIASDATTYLTLPTSNGVENISSPTKGDTGSLPDIIYCEQCGTAFSGTYRRSNRKRHVKAKHTEANAGPYRCVANGCYRDFARPDARLKHARKRHPGLYLEPVGRKAGHGKEPTTPQPVPTSSPSSTHGSGRKTRMNYQAPTSNRPTMDTIPTSCSGDYETSSLFSRPMLYSTSQPSKSIVRSSTIDTQASSAAASSLDFNVGQWLHSTPQSSISEGSIVYEDSPKLQREDISPIEVEELPRMARIVLTSLHANLDTKKYSQLCVSGLQRWEAIMQKLRDEQSESYPVYAKVIKDICSIVHAIDTGIIDSSKLDRTMENSHASWSDQNHQKGSKTGSSFSKSLGFGVGASPANWKSNHHKALHSSGSGPDVKVTKKEKSKKSESKPVNCPEYLRWFMTSQTLLDQPCRGCRETLMSQVRSHLNRVSHPSLTIAKQCGVCKREFVNQQAYDSHKAARRCQHVPQSRNDIVVPWARLYLTKYPNDTMIPNPCKSSRFLQALVLVRYYAFSLPHPLEFILCTTSTDRCAINCMVYLTPTNPLFLVCDESGWLPNEIVAECRASMSLPINSFLGQPGPRLSIYLAPAASTTPIPVEEARYNAGLSFVLQDLVAPIHERSNNAEAAVLAESVSRLNAAGPSEPVSDDVERFIRILRGTSNLFSQLRGEASRFISEEQLQQICTEAEMQVQPTRESRRHRTLGVQDRAAPPPSTPVVTNTMYSQSEATLLADVNLSLFPGQYMDPSYTALANNQASPAASHEQYSAISMSTHPSSQGFGTSSSHHASYQSGPSSAHDPSDRPLFSPVQSENHWNVRPPQVLLEAPQVCPTWSRPRATQDGTIDPLLLESSWEEDDDSQLEEFSRRFC